MQNRISDLVAVLISLAILALIGFSYAFYQYERNRLDKSLKKTAPPSTDTPPLPDAAFNTFPSTVQFTRRDTVRSVPLGVIIVEMLIEGDRRSDLQADVWLYNQAENLFEMQSFPEGARRVASTEVILRLLNDGRAMRLTPEQVSQLRAGSISISDLVSSGYSEVVRTAEALLQQSVSSAEAQIQSVMDRALRSTSLSMSRTLDRAFSNPNATFSWETVTSSVDPGNSVRKPSDAKTKKAPPAEKPPEQPAKSRIERLLDEDDDL